MAPEETMTDIPNHDDALEMHLHEEMAKELAISDRDFLYGVRWEVLKGHFWRQIPMIYTIQELANPGINVRVPVRHTHVQVHTGVEGALERSLGEYYATLYNKLERSVIEAGFHIIKRYEIVRQPL
jgi:hypothetical protein